MIEATIELVTVQQEASGDNGSIQSTQYVALSSKLPQLAEGCVPQLNTAAKKKVKVHNVITMKALVTQSNYEPGTPTNMRR